MRWLLPLLAFTFSGCVHVSKDVIMDRSDHPVPREDVRVVTSDDDIAESCELVAYLQASATEELSDDQDVADKITKKAGKLGANVVYVRELYGGSGPRSSVFEAGSDREFDVEAFWCPEEANGG